MTTDETTDTATETEHDSATCTHPVVMQLTVTRKPDPDPEHAAHEVELSMHIHSTAEARTCLEGISDAEARLQAMVLLHRLQTQVPSAVLDEMLAGLDAIVFSVADDEH